MGIVSFCMLKLFRSGIVLGSERLSKAPELLTPGALRPMIWSDSVCHCAGFSRLGSPWPIRSRISEILNTLYRNSLLLHLKANSFVLGDLQHQIRECVMQLIPDKIGEK